MFPLPEELGDRICKSGGPVHPLGTRKLKFPPQSCFKATFNDRAEYNFKQV